MFKFYVGSRLEIFDNRKQAYDFYNLGAYECEGAESDRYSEYAEAIENTNNDEKCEYNFSGEVNGVFVYNAKEGYLQLVDEK